MRPIHVLLGLVVVLASGASAYVAARMAVPTDIQEPRLVEAKSEPAVDGDSSLELRAAQDRLAMMSARLDALTLELETLRNAAHREPAAVAALPMDDLVSAAAAGSVTPQQRDMVLAVLAEERAREAAEREAKRAQDDVEQAKRRAARVAKDLSLSPGDEVRLAELMVEGNKKRQEMFEPMRNGGFDRDTARAQFESYRTWQTEQYTQAFGASIADQILANEVERMGFGGMRGGDNAGGPGGGNQGRQGRRGGAQAAGGGAQQQN